MTGSCVTFITVTRNRKEDLRRALASIRRQRWEEKEVIVVDNASDDGTASMVEQEFPEVKYIALLENYGATGGRNRGIAKAAGEIIIFVDDDVELIQHDTVERVMELLKKNVGGVTFLTVKPEDRQPDRLHIPRKDKKMQEGECCMFIAGNCAFRKAVFDEVGSFWEQLNPFGGGELDLSYRIIDAGYIMRWTHSITAIHHESAVERPSWRRIYYMARNRPWIIARHLPWRYVIVSTAAWWGYLLLQALKSGNLLWWCKGVAACVKGFPAALRERKRIKPETLRYYQKNSGALWW